MFFLNNHRTAVQKTRDAYRKRVKTRESLKCQLTICEKNQNTECQSEYNKGMRPGWLVLRKLWHIETTPFKKFMTNLKKWHVSRFTTSTVKPKSYGDKTQMFLRSRSVRCLLSQWSLNFQISDICTHCVPIFINLLVLLYVGILPLTNTFCSFSGTRYGQGTYFARDASYSLVYAKAGAEGHRYMYLARVLVGQYCVGNSDMKVPPARDPSKPEILYESVVDNQVDPSIFVVFYDNQCYPEYLITMQ